MRTIKFRAWDGKRMTTSGIMFNSTTGCLVVPDGSQMKLMQFTGLHDKNGVEIYFGDIVKAKEGEEYAGGLSNIDEDGFCISDVILGDGLQVQLRLRGGNFKYSHGLPLTWGGYESIEVIGNIHQNPELL